MNKMILLVCGYLLVLMFIVMVTMLVFVGKSVGEMYFACMLSLIPCSIGCIAAAYVDTLPHNGDD